MNLNPIAWSRTLSVLGSGVAVFSPLMAALAMANLTDVIVLPLGVSNPLAMIPVIGFFFFAYVLGELAISIGELLIGKYFLKVGKRDRLYGSFRGKIDPFDDDFLFVLDLDLAAWTREYEIVRHRIETVSGLAGALLIGAPLTLGCGIALNLQGYVFASATFPIIAFLATMLGLLIPLTALILTSRFGERLKLFDKEQKQRRELENSNATANPGEAATDADRI